MPERLAAALVDRYRIERELGQGGMAMVYLAQDLKHDRKVALKVLKPELAAVLGAERFVVEIKTTAALQHPHILPLFDSGIADGFLYYVMPFIDGETLRDKLNRETQLGVDEAVGIARDVADALDYAHGKGVIHRDIKPENILLANGRPMVADFGIALAVSAAAGGRMTETGLSLGTPHYMSPEQATADKDITVRSDVYSLASVLYEMLTGHPPHTGASAQQIIMKIVTDTARPVTELRKSVPPNVAAAVSQALEKLPADRFESAKAFAAALGDPGFSVRTGQSVGAGARSLRSWNRVTLAMTGLAVILALLLARKSLMPGGEPVAAAPVVRFTLSSDGSLSVITGATRPFAVSPDGQTVVFRGATDSLGPHLWVRSIGDPKARLLEGTLDGMNPAISPDGKSVAFIVQNRYLRTVPLAGGGIRQVATLESMCAALSWASNDDILLEALAPEDGIHSVSSNGGTAERVVPLDTAGGEVLQRRPLMLRESGLIGYGSTTRGRDETEIALYRPSDGRRAQLGISGIGPLALIDGRLIYAGALGELMAVRLDTRAMQISGPPVLLTPRVAAGWTGTAVALSEGGTLVYRTENASVDARLNLVDTGGAVRALPGTFGVYGTPRFSPDGRRVVLGLGTDGMRGRRIGIGFSDLWVVDAGTGEPTRLTSGVQAASPSWFPDGQRVVFSVQVDGKPGLWSVPVGGGAAPSPLVDLGSVPRNSAITPDGRSVIVSTNRGGAASTSGLIRAWLDGSRRLDTLVTLRADGIRAEDPRVSPDGRWVAFIERSTYEVWVRSLTGAGLLQVSTKGTEGNPVAWGPDSRRLYYANTEGLHVIELLTAPSLGVERRRVVGHFPLTTDYDLSPDGHTFIAVVPIRAADDVIVVVNWIEEARRTWSTPTAR